MASNILECIENRIYLRDELKLSHTVWSIYIYILKSYIILTVIDFSIQNIDCQSESCLYRPKCIALLLNMVMKYCKPLSKVSNMLPKLKVY